MAMLVYRRVLYIMSLDAVTRVDLPALFDGESHGSRLSGSLPGYPSHGMDGISTGIYSYLYLYP